MALYASIAGVRTDVQSCFVPGGPAMQKQWLGTLAAGLLLFFGCAPQEPAQLTETVQPEPDDSSAQEKYIETGDLAEIRRRGILRIVDRVQGERQHLPRARDPFQRERELAQDFASELGLNLVFVSAELDEFIPIVVAGKADIALVRLPPASERLESVLYSIPVTSSREIIATRAEDSQPRSLKDLRGMRVAVLQSPHMRPIEALRADLPGPEFQQITGPYTQDDLLYRVSTGKLDAALVNSNWMEVASGYRSNLQIAHELPGPQQLVGAVRANAANLQKALDDFLITTASESGKRQVYTEDLPGIKKRKALRVLTVNRPPCYFLERGQLRGFEYELAGHLAKQIGVRLEVNVPPALQDLVPWLMQGRGDLVVADLPAADFQGVEGIAVSDPYQRIAETIVCRPEGPCPAKLHDLAGREVHIYQGSRAWRALEATQADGIAVRFSRVSTGVSPAEIIDRVATSEFDLAAVHRHLLDFELNWRDDVKAAFSLGEPVPHVWLVRESNPALLHAVNDFIAREYRGTFYNVLRQRYFHGPRSRHRRTEWQPSRGRQLSPYDDLLRRYAAKYRFDWRLAAALMYQESRFDPSARGPTGALGLFQVLPRTGRAMGFKDLTEPAVGIQAGLKYLSRLRGRFETNLEGAERVAFTAAAYNAGHGHVLDARRVAEARGLNPDRWFGNVEKAILLLSKPEVARRARFGYCRGILPYRYVREIRDRFRAYTRAVER